MTGWNAAKVEAFREGYADFLDRVTIDSKDTGGGTNLGQNIYQSQERFYDAVWSALSNDIHDIKCLKSRQLGISTACRPLVTFWMGVHDGLQGAMIFDTDAHKEAARRDIETMVKELHENFPSYRFPTIERSNRYGFLLSNRSFLHFMAAGVKTSRSAGVLGRSSGLSLVWGSEMCSWENAEGLISLRSSISHNNPNRLYLWESTARGPNEWKTMWEEACIDDLNQAAVFIGWWAREDQRLRRGTPQFERYGRQPPTEEEQARIDAVEKFYGHHVDQEQLAWYRYFSDPTQKENTGAPDVQDGLIQQDQPWTEQEAFILTGSTFFNYQKLTEVHNTTVSTKFQAFKFMPGGDFTTCAIIPARTYRDIELRVWEEPQIEATYVIGGDVAYGHSEKNDRSAIEVCKCYADGIEQVAEYISGSVMPHQLAWMLWVLAGYYGSKSGQQVMMIVELNGPGEAVWREIGQVRQIVNAGYLRTQAEAKGIADIGRNVRQYVYGRSDSMGAGHNYQWKTTPQLKVAVMERLRDFLHQNVLVLRSAELVEEMRIITRDGDTIEAEGKGKDDRAVSIALCCRAWEEKLRRGLIATNKTRAAEKARRGLAVSDQKALFDQYQLANFFKAKAGARLAVQRAANDWRRGGTRRY